MKRLASIVWLLVLAAGLAHGQGAWEYGIVQYSASGSNALIEVALPSADAQRFSGPVLETARQAIRYVGGEPDTSTPSMLSVLNAMGAVGWELTASHLQAGTYVHFFKRPLP